MLEILNGRDKFYQWDVNQKLIVDDNIIAVQYDNGTGDALVCGVYEYEGQRVADVPNIMLQTYWAIKCYAYCGECVRAEKVYEVEKRSRPDDYIYTETETLRYTTLYDMLTDTKEQLEAQHNTDVAALEQGLEELEAQHSRDIETVEQQLAATNKDVAEVENKLASTNKNVSANVAAIAATNENVAELETQLDNTNNTVNAAIGRIETLEKQPTGGTGTAADVDWAENDSTSPAYIKNRTHYEEWQQKTIYDGDLAISTEDGMPMAMITSPLGLEAGKTYTVYWNGVAYETTASKPEDIVFLGNLDAMNGTGDTGEPFIIAEYGADMAAETGVNVLVLAIMGDTAVSMKITWEGIVVYQIDDKYINFKQPDWNAAEDEPGYIANRTHYIENYGTLKLDNNNLDGLESFVYNSTTYYKVSDALLSLDAMEQCNVSMTTGTTQSGTTAKDSITDNNTYRHFTITGKCHCIVVCDKDATNLNAEIPSTGTYIGNLGGYDTITITANAIYHKIHTKFLDLSNYYTKTQANNYVLNQLTKYYTKTEVDALISEAVAAAVSGVNE